MLTLLPVLWRLILLEGWHALDILERGQYCEVLKVLSCAAEFYLDGPYQAQSRHRLMKTLGWLSFLSDSLKLWGFHFYWLYTLNSRSARGHMWHLMRDYFRTRSGIRIINRDSATIEFWSWHTDIFAKGVFVPRVVTQVVIGMPFIV